MDSKFETQFLLFLSMVYIIQIQNTNCMKSLQSFKLKKVPLIETSDPVAARSIYNDYGVTDKKYLCRSYDEKTSRMNAYSICKQAKIKLLNLKLGSNIIVLDSKIKCEYVMVTLDYKHAEKFKKTEWICPHFHEFTHTKHMMAYCGDIDEKDEFYAVYVKSDYYYIFIGEKNKYFPSIKAVLKLNPPKSVDYPNIKLEGTGIVRIADNIFGWFGVSNDYKSKNDPGHVCYQTSKDPKIIVGDEICPLALDKCGLQPILNAKVTCESHKINRFTRNGCEFYQKKSKTLEGAECMYSDNNFPNSLLIINGPQKGWYYAAKASLSRPKDFFVTNVFQVELEAKKS